MDIFWNLVNKEFCSECGKCGGMFQSVDYRRTGVDSAATANSTGDWGLNKKGILFVVFLFNFEACQIKTSIPGNFYENARLSGMAMDKMAVVLKSWSVESRRLGVKRANLE